jgi:hypothetical protein
MLLDTDPAHCHYKILKNIEKLTDSGSDLIKQLLAGAKAAQACTILYQKRLEIIKDILARLEFWMESQSLATIEDFRAELSFKNQELRFRGLGEAEAYFRAQYLKTYKGFQ